MLFVDNARIEVDDVPLRRFFRPQTLDNHIKPQESPSEPIVFF